MITFDEKNHKYYWNGKELISVTTLMKKHGLAPDYSLVSSEVLEAKAERGTLIHAEIEDYIKHGEIGFTKELEAFRKYLFINQVEVIKSEQIVYNDIVAGTLDLYLKKDGFIIADIKTTSTLHKESVSWQLSIYLYLLVNQTAGNKEEYNQHKGQAFHFDNEGNLKVVDIPLKPYDEIELLMKVERNGFEKYHLPQIELDPYQIQIIQEASAIIERAKKEQKEAEEKLNLIKEALINAMEENGVKAFENDYFKITYVAPVEKSSIDSARLKKEQPEIAEQYTKTTSQKASVRITLKEQKDNE